MTTHVSSVDVDVLSASIRLRPKRRVRPGDPVVSRGERLRRGVLFDNEIDIIDCYIDLIAALAIAGGRGFQRTFRRHIVAGQTNAKHLLSFSDGAISACVYENVENLVVDGIVVNLSTQTIWHEGSVNAPIQPWRSSTVTKGKFLKADRIAVLKVEEPENIGGVMLRGWTWFGDVFRGLPRGIPLYVSSIDTVGSVSEDPMAFTRERPVAEEMRRFDIKLKLWWSPGKTDAFIHNEHPFLETHTQIYGYGRMQKFRQRKAEAVYEDVVMAPGFTHEPFCLVTGADEYKYPWHRYYADTDAFWLAIELHPQTPGQ